jgi:hypothetical protein
LLTLGKKGGKIENIDKTVKIVSPSSLDTRVNDERMECRGRLQDMAQGMLINMK